MLRDNPPGFVELAPFQAGHDLIGVRRPGASEAARSMRSEFVSGNYFALFGIGPYAGRGITPDDDRKGAPPVAVISYRAWQQQFGGDPSIVGGSLTLNGQPFTVVGIAPPAFFGDRLTDPAAFWIPITAEPLIDGPGAIIDFPQQDWLDVIGRITPGADPKQIGAHMQVELQQWLLSPIDQLQPGGVDAVPKQTLRLAPGGAGVQQLRDQYLSSLHLLMWISALVLAIACANVANLLLVRATSRKLQTSIRAALGAPPSRQMRQVLTESIVLAVLGGIMGVGIAFGGTHLILRLAFPVTDVAIHASPSLPVLAFTFAVSLLTGILFGVAPAWITANAAPADALRGAGRSSGSSGGWTQKIPRDCAGGAVARLAFCRRPADAKPAKYAGPAFRLRDAQSVHCPHRSANGGIQTSADAGAFPPASRFARGDTRRRAGQLLALQSNGGRQLGRNRAYRRVGASAA